MVTGKLIKGEALVLTTTCSFPLTMSERGGVPAAELSEIPAGTRLLVARHCEPDEYDIPFYLADDQHKKAGNGLPFSMIRMFLHREAPLPGGEKRSSP